MQDRLFDIWFSLRAGIANREFPYVLEKYENTYQVFSAEEQELEKLPCSDRFKQALADKDLAEAHRILEYCERNGIRLLFWQDDDYPASLRMLLDPPSLLYCEGTLPDFAHLLCISVVGTRKMSEYGRRMAYKIGYELASANAVVVSGMALGVDSVAAAGALRAGGTTVAVLGCGIDITYPAEHTALRSVIVKHGAVITEFPPAARPEGRNFPIRNRLISGLSQGTVVIEADSKSGSLITARDAIMQGHDIYAVPGNVGEDNTSGTNQLIRDGAAVVLDARDILENYQFLYRDALRMGRLVAAEKQSEPDEDALLAWGVCSSVVNSRRNADTPSPRQKQQTPPDRVPVRPAPEKRETTGVPARVSADIPARVPARTPAPPPGQETNNAPAPSPEPQISRTPVTDSDRSRNALESLTETQRRIFECLPLDHAVTVDMIVREGFTLSEVMAAMTVMEIKGLTVTLPGCLYARR